MYVILSAVIAVLSLAACGQKNLISLEPGPPLYHTMTLPTSKEKDGQYQTEKQTPIEKRSGNGGPRYTPL